ncbi:hypothetical protein [Ktedonobacter robiniae]|uniref:Uncharacterized protein n=1 Tax=Ktedonobacter robiniae TaxID=2778365 RepID=A0ABQ3UG67_9CHLR|nr:hypothetical protein [Ktedonobacter robiniae]GHO51701.1 hypothetical protein KSB_01760 [Ktedonobacter robiniae]
MATSEERLTTLERTVTGYKPVLQEIAYELTMVKGLTVDQIRVTQELKSDIDGVKQDIGTINERLSQMDEKLNTILSLLKPS